MKKLGIVGGIGPESTVDYYRLLIKMYREAKSDGNYPEILINSINMTKMLNLVGNKKWEQLIKYLSDSIKVLSDAGAEYAIIASNTPHIVFNEVVTTSPIPILSIVEVTCKKANLLGLKRVGLLGTRMTMQTDYYARVFEGAGIKVFVPKDEEQEYIHTKIFSELQSLIIKEDTRKGLLKIVEDMTIRNSIDGLILGCTELPLILSHDEYGIKFLNTSFIHAEAALNYGLGKVVF